MTFEQARFNLVCALSNVEAKKRFEFLESVGEAMDAHLRYFKQGYELLHQIEPYIHQVLNACLIGHIYNAFQLLSSQLNIYKVTIYFLLHVLLNAQTSKESYRSEKRALNERIQEYKRHIDVGNRQSSNPSVCNEDLVPQHPRNSHKLIQAVMQYAAEGKVCALSNVEAKKRFEFLESVGEAMDAHLRYFKQGYELLHQFEPYIHQVLLNAQTS